MFSQHALIINIMMNRLLRQMILLQCHGDFSFFREISFAAFLISGILGSVNYYKSGNLDLKTAGVLSAGSFVGALAGVKINLLIPADTMKIILYLIVLLSGISILLRKDKPGNTE